SAGDFIYSTQTLYIYAESGTTPNCTDENTFVVTIDITPSIDNPGPQIACGSLDLPTISGSNLTGNAAYFDQSQANNGNEITGPITSSMTVWIYDETVSGCSDEVSFMVTIDTIPMVNCPADTSFCIDHGMVDISMLNPAANPSGGTFSGNGVTGNDFDPASAGVGVHEVTYVFTDGNGCTDSCTFEIEVFDLPVVDCPADVEDVFVGSDPFTLTGAAPSGGAYSGPGVSGGEFDPSAAGVGTHIITYTFEDSNGCQNTCTFEIEVVPTPPVTCPSSFEICLNAEPVELTGADPAGGNYSGPGVEDNEFNPTAAGVGVHIIVYTAPSSDTCSFEIEVLALPMLVCPVDTSFCIDNGLVDLSELGATPVGGTFTGDGVSGNDFDPSVSGSGIHSITYTYTDGNGCTDSCTFEIEVFDLPVLTCPSDQEICIDEDSLDLTGLGIDPSGGSFSGAGVSGTEFSPSTAGVGTHTITYTYTDGNGCTNTCTFEVEVFDLPVVNCPADQEYCLDDDAVDLTELGADPAGGSFSGAGVSGTEFSPSAAGVGTHTITYTYTDGNGCINTCTFEVEVFDLAVVNCPADQQYCIDDDPVDLTMLGADPTGGTFSGDGVSGDDFNPSVAGVGIHTITYTYTDGNGCENSCSFEITVNGLPVVNCPADIAVCENADPFVLEGASPEGGTYSGPGVTGGEFDAGIAGLGAHMITYIYTDGNGCEASCSFVIEVIEDTEAPSLTCPPAQIIDAEGSCAVQIPDFTGLAIVSDNCSEEENITVNQIPAPGLTAITETINIFIIATDEAGNSVNCSFLLMLENFGEIPTLDCGDGLVELNNDPGECGAEVELEIEFVEDCEGGQEVVNSFTNGGLNADAFYPVGTTIVEFVLLDNGDTLSQCSVTVLIEDNEAPQITCPADVTIDTDTGECFATYSPALATAIDNCGIASIENNAPSTFSLSHTVVVHTATDENGNTANCDQVVTVEDNELPQITCPTDVTVDTDTGECFATYSPVIGTATDNCGIATIANNAPATFPVGNTIVVHTATDVNGNLANCDQVVSVEDNEAPVANCPSDVTISMNPGSCFGSYSAPSFMVSDNCGVENISNDAPGSFPPGNTTISYQIEDVNGNITSCQQIVTVIDTENPSISCPQDVMVEVAAGVMEIFVDIPEATAEDNCSIASIDNDFNGGADASGIYPLGTTSIVFTATDGSGNTANCTFTVTVIEEDGDLEEFFLSGNISTIFGVNISDVEVNMTGDQMGADTSDMDGNYSIQVTEGSSVNLTPEKNSDWLNGVTTFDLVLIQQSILLVEPITSPYLIIASDANADGMKSTFDMVLLSNLIVGNLTEIVGNTSWRFIPADYEFDEPFDLSAQNWPEFISLSNVSGDLDSLDFIAIKTGDVSGDAGTGSRIVYDEKELILQWKRTDNDELAAVIRPSGKVSATGYQMEFNFPTYAIEEFDVVLEYSDLMNLSENNYFIDRDRGILRINWWNGLGQEMDAQSELFRIHLRPANGIDGNPALLELVDRGGLWYSEWYDTESNIYRLRLHEKAQVEGEYVLHQNRPNPYRDHTTLLFELPDEMEVTLEILDVSGRLIRTTTLSGNRGMNQFHLEVSDLPSGVNYYRLITDEWNATRKMIKVE
ncbi:MAG: HYR domain-containing protein, partial [Saprospirales bacterium]